MRPENLAPHHGTRFPFVLVLILGLSASFALAQSFSVVHNFSGATDGADPLNGLVRDASGNLYGTSSAGGLSNNGVVYKLSAANYLTVVHKFKGGKDGSNPQGLLLLDVAGNIYGTSSGGGTHGAGTVFKITGITETVLYSFVGQADGANPVAGLIADAAGNLYGTTTAGGSTGNGTVFKLSPPTKLNPKWTEQVLCSFAGGTDGSTPVGAVALDASGNLYGTTSAGGYYGFGTVFQLTPGITWTENTLHNFQNGADGGVPYAGLIADKSGNFYGAATEGGTNGGGTIFELTPSNGVWNFAVIYSVPGWGISGSFRNVVLDGSGNLYATTHCDGDYNSGTIYELTPAGGTWNYNLLYTFTGGHDGLYSFSTLVSSNGRLYGTTKYGGTKNNGVIFQVTP
jgi:uncharacterized repeat protein (TIGR03803 family)